MVCACFLFSPSSASTFLPLTSPLSFCTLLRVVTVHCQETISGLKRFNACRKLKAAVHTAMIVSRRSTNFCECVCVGGHVGGGVWVVCGREK